MKPRALVRNTAGVVKDVAASAVPIMAPAGWRVLDAAEVVAYREQMAAEKAARKEALTPRSARRPAAPAPTAAAPPPVDEAAEKPSPTKRSGGGRRAESTNPTESEQES